MSFLQQDGRVSKISSIIQKKDKEDSYRRYQPQNRNSNEKVIRPFYKWKDGFVDNYLKYCSPDAIKFRAKRLMRIPEDTQQSMEEADEILPSQPTSPTVKAKVFLEGNKKSFEVQLSQDVLPKLKDVEAEEQLEAQRLSPRGNEVQSKDYMLKSSLFNPQDNIKPIKNYYYNDRGVMSREGRKKKAYGIKSYIQSVSNDLVLA